MKIVPQLGVLISLKAFLTVLLIGLLFSLSFQAVAYPTDLRLLNGKMDGPLVQSLFQSCLLTTIRSPEVSHRP